MINYRDYGAMNGTSASNVAINTIHHSQVYTATHDEAGASLPFMNRSFISFSWGGKNIEDFNLLAIIENNSLQRKLYADFEDNITEFNIWDGQIYWSSHFNGNSISFALFTDGITENQLGDFKHYFQPGKIEELILSENPNRAIYARVSKVPEYSILPFEEKITIKIAGNDYNTSTTMYKGRISLEFTTDEPFWHSRANILNKQKINGLYESDKWIDANGHDSIILDDKDALKILTEDGIPISSMIYNDQSFLENSQILFGTENDIIIEIPEGSENSRIGEATIGYGCIAYTLSINSTIELLTPSTIFDNDEKADIINSLGYFYYAGTAPCAPILQFAFRPVVNEEGYIIFPRNSYGTTSGNKFNTIIIRSQTKKRFQFTTPGIYTGYNQVIKILKDTSLIGAAWEDIRVAIRDNVKHWAPRAYAISVINNIKESTSTTKTTSSLLNTCVSNMYNFLLNNTGVIPLTTYTFNCKTGEAFAKIIFRNTDDVPMFSEENVGDMVCSNYLLIEDRNYPTENGYVQPWTNENPTNSHCIYSDAELVNVNLQYKYLYL